MICEPVERVNACLNEKRGSPGRNDILRLTDGLGCNDVFGIEDYSRPPFGGDVLDQTVGRAQIEPVAVQEHVDVSRAFTPNRWILRIIRAGQPDRGIVVALHPDPEHVDILVSGVFEVRATRARSSEFFGQLI